MDDSFGVHVADTFHDGIHEVLDLSSCHRVLISLNNIHQVLATVLHDKVELVEVFWVCWSHDSLEFNDVLVTSEDSHESHFSKQSMSVYVAFEDVLNRLDGYCFLLPIFSCLNGLVNQGCSSKP